MPGIRFGARRGVLLKGAGVAAVTYSITPAAFNINEGSALTFTVTAPVDGTYTWTVNDITTVSGDFSASSGSVSITSNAGSFTITPTADVTTEGAQTFTVSLQTVLEGRPPTITTHATSGTITVNDTSVTIQGLYSWGRGTNGALGLGNTTSYSSPKQVSALTTWTALSSGQECTLAIKTDGTLWSWGQGTGGVLGHGNTTNYSSPKQVGALTTWSKISSGQRMSLAVKTNGTLWAWGYGSYGRLGLGNTTTYYSPKQVGALTAWAAVAAGLSTGFAVKTDGTLWSWGKGSYGTLGLGNTTSYSSPKQVGALTTWSANLSNNYGGHVAAIKTDGTLWTWGYGSSGRLGLGNDTSYSSPKQVGALTTWSKISTTEKSCAAIKTNGTLWTWGYNSYGRLGLGDTTTRRSPVQIGALTDWSQVAIGFKAKHGLAVLTTGTLFSWGRNNNGQLGLGNTTDYSSPKQVPAGTTWSKVSSGADLSVAIAT